MTKFYDSVPIENGSQTMYNQIFFIQNFFQDPMLLKEEKHMMEKNLEDSLSQLDSDYGEIEQYEKGELTSEDIKQIYAKEIRPIVIRNFASDFDCVKLWSPDFFKKHYSDFLIWYSSTDSLMENQKIKLGDFIDEVLKGSIDRKYVENLSDIFNAFPELHDHVGIDMLDQFFGDFASYHKISQFFFGGRGTGASLHCANELNGFLNVFGQKEWHFMHPKYSLAMYSTNFNKGIFVGSLAKHNAPKGYLEAEQPLFSRIPKLKIVLNPGDLLINPPWWWHAVNNVTPQTISVATRWKINIEYQKQNPLYDLVQSMRSERLSIEGKKMETSDVVVPDSELRGKYVSYDEMGWKSD